MKALTYILSLCVVLAAQPVLGAQPETWTVDPVHSTAQFTARHFGIVPVIGTIPIEQGHRLRSMPARRSRAVSAALDASKVDTHNDTRDGDLRSAALFQRRTPRPKIRFASTKVEGTHP